MLSNLRTGKENEWEDLKLTLYEGVPSLPADLVGRKGRVEGEVIQLGVFAL